MNKIQRHERKTIQNQGDAIPNIPVPVSAENAPAIAKLTQTDVNAYIGALSSGSVENQIITAVGVLQRVITELTYMGVDLNEAYFAVLAQKDLDIEQLGGIQADSNSVIHAERELKIIGESEETIAGVVNTISAWHEMGHSGGSHFALMPVLERLMNHQNLTPLTNDPQEWFYHGNEQYGIEPTDGGMWQNVRNGAAFSDDGGATYYLVSEGANDKNKFPLYKSVDVLNQNSEENDVAPE